MYRKAALLAAVVAAFSSTPSAAYEFKIAFSVPQLANPWFRGVQQGMDKACEELGIKCDTVDAGYDAQKQVDDVTGMIAAGYNAILLTPIDANMMIDPVDKARQAGIPTASLAQTVPNTNLLYGMDEFNYGYTIGLQAAEWARDNLDCKAEVVMVTQDNVEAVKARGDGVEAALTETCPAIKVVVRKAGDNPELGSQIVSEALGDYPNINMAVCTNDSGCIGAYSAMVAGGKAGPRVGVFSGDATRECLELIRQPESIYRGTVDLNPFKGGYESTKILFRMANQGIPDSPEQEMLPYVPVLAEDVLSGHFVPTY
ncbi:MAG: sugar ABC transporter substrate-binding protein [Succinivibrionaceae bacterium]|nr:sugar ABC transporter substrate-binding protein [Succinivibrionaceae bacterium]